MIEQDAWCLPLMLSRLRHINLLTTVYRSLLSHTINHPCSADISLASTSLSNLSIHPSHCLSPWSNTSRVRSTYLPHQIPFFGSPHSQTIAIFPVLQICFYISWYPYILHSIHPDKFLKHPIPITFKLLLYADLIP